MGEVPLDRAAHRLGRIDRTEPELLARVARIDEEVLRESASETQVGRKRLVRHAHEFDLRARGSGDLSHPEPERRRSRLGDVVDDAWPGRGDRESRRLRYVAHVSACEEQVPCPDRDAFATRAYPPQDRFLAREIVLLAEDDGETQHDGVAGEIRALHRDFVVVGPGEAPAWELDARVRERALSEGRLLGERKRIGFHPRPERSERSIDVHAAEQDELDAPRERLERGARVREGHGAGVDCRFGPERRDVASVRRKIRTRRVQVTDAGDVFDFVLAAMDDQHFVLVGEQLFENREPDEARTAKENDPHASPFLRDRSRLRARRAQVVGGSQQDLRAADARGNGDHLEELDSLVGVDRIVLLAPERRDASADVAGERLHLLQRHRVHLAIAGEPGERLEIELRSRRHHREADAVAIAADDQRLEHLLRREPYLARDGLGAEILLVDFVIAQLVADTEPVENACRIRFQMVASQKGSEDGDGIAPRASRLAASSSFARVSNSSRTLRSGAPFDRSAAISSTIPARSRRCSAGILCPPAEPASAERTASRARSSGAGSGIRPASSSTRASAMAETRSAMACSTWSSPPSYGVDSSNTDARVSAGPWNVSAGALSIASVVRPPFFISPTGRAANAFVSKRRPSDGR